MKTYTRDQIQDIVVDVLSEHTSMPVHITDVRIEDIGIDSLELFEVIIDIEERFDIEILDEDAELWQTPDDIVDYLRDILDSPYTP
jgi:acyl carrier protein